MGLHEIDTILKESRDLVKLNISDQNLMKDIIWNIEEIPVRYEFDAGGFERLENDQRNSYKPMNIFEVAEYIVKIGLEKNDSTLVYNWSVFLMNWWGNFKEDVEQLGGVEVLKNGPLKSIRQAFYNLKCEGQKPVHRSLSLIKNPDSEEFEGWFSQDQAALMVWFQTEDR